MHMTMIQIKRVYEAAAKEDGARFLVERLWPRGMKKDALHMDVWCKSLAPSGDLRRWFSHDPAKWKEFQRWYRAEHADNPAACQPLLDAAKQGNITGSGANLKGSASGGNGLDDRTGLRTGTLQGVGISTKR